MEEPGKEALTLDGGVDEFLGRCSAFDFLASAVAVFDREHLRYANHAFETLNRTARDDPEHLHRLPSLLACPDLSVWLKKALASSKEESIRRRIYYAPRIEMELTLCLRPLFGSGESRLGSILSIGEESIAFDRLHLARYQESYRTLTARIRQLDHEKSQADHLSKLLLKNAPVAMLIFNDHLQVIQANRAAERLFGLPAPQMIGKACNTFLDCISRHKQCPVRQDGGIEGNICEGRRADGTQLILLRNTSELHDGESGLIVETLVDMTEYRAAENRIAHLAHHDALTGLLNRFSLRDRLEQALAGARRKQASLAVLFVDIDRFKTINDALGHSVGDALLVETGKRLNKNIRQSDIVARFGDDEFVVVLTDIENATAAAHVADNLRANLDPPYLIDGKTLHLTSSIGLALYPEDGEDGETLMKNADSAMHHAKEEGRNNVQFFTASINQLVTERRHLEEELRTALEEEQFELHYQPKVDPQGNCVSFEALVRWRHPRDGLVSPAKFIPVAEECNLIGPLGAWVIGEACRQLRIWRDAGLAGVNIAANLSAEQLRSQELPRIVQQALEQYGLSSGDLELEITESVAMHNPEASIRQLLALRDLGIRLAIDDFGTGYSSLNYLKRLPIQSLKLDQSFVRDIETDPNDVAICAATIALAHSLGLTVIAEGVETEVQRDFLIRHRCDYLQGYLFSKPLPAAQAFDFVKGR